MLKIFHKVNAHPTHGFIEEEPPHVIIKTILNTRSLARHRIIIDNDSAMTYPIIIGH
jgi:hypothetical protein